MLDRDCWLEGKKEKLWGGAGGQKVMYLLSFGGTPEMGLLERKGVINETDTTSIETEKTGLGG